MEKKEKKKEKRKGILEVKEKKKEKREVISETESSSEDSERVERRHPRRKAVIARTVDQRVTQRDTRNYI